MYVHTTVLFTNSDNMYNAALDVSYQRNSTIASLYFSYWICFAQQVERFFKCISNLNDYHDQNKIFLSFN